MNIYYCLPNQLYPPNRSQLSSCLLEACNEIDRPPERQSEHLWQKGFSFSHSEAIFFLDYRRVDLSALRIRYKWSALAHKSVRLINLVVLPKENCLRREISLAPVISSCLGRRCTRLRRPNPSSCWSQR